MRQEYDFSAGERGRFFRKDAKTSLPASGEEPNWIGPAGQLCKFLVERAERILASYREEPLRVTEDANSEQSAAYGGYAHRQLFELVQNSADALLGAPKGQSILIRLTERFLYCADDGAHVDEDGIVGLMFSRMSSKRSSSTRNIRPIGRFGLGFKSVLGVTDAPEFYSRSASFRFDKTRAMERIAKVAPADRYPVLRLPEPIDPDEARSTDEELSELMRWATNIVRLPLKMGAHDDLAKQIGDFPPEFLLFVDHVRYLTLDDGERSRDFMLHRRDGELRLDTGEGTARWRRFDTTHRLSAEARAAWPSRDDSDEALVQWALPLDRLDRPGHFWAFFPTTTASLVAGILNAPWKTNEDRQNLLSGPYNDELIEAATAMIAETLPKLATDDDPARHLDALPRRHQGGDTEQADLIRKHLFSNLHEREIAPDQDGNLHAVGEVSYPPIELTADRQMDMALFERWASCPDRPSNWLHHKALTRNRLATIDRLFPPRWRGDSPSAPRATLAEWLGALVEDQEPGDAVRASMAAIQTAAAIPPAIRSNEELGDIVLTASGAWLSPAPAHLFLPIESLNGEGTADSGSYVHPKLASDPDTLRALKELGLKPPSPESYFRQVAGRVLQADSEQEAGLLDEFWKASRKLESKRAHAIICEFKKGPSRDRREAWPTRLRVRSRAGEWQPLHSVLLPGELAPGGGGLDEIATVDKLFHEPDDELLRALGVTEAPNDGRDLSLEPGFAAFQDSWRTKYRAQEKLPHKPVWGNLEFTRTSTKGAGPLQVLTTLSDHGRSLYTDALLKLDAGYEKWTMWHTGTNRQSYPQMPCESLTIHMLRENGRIRTPTGIVPLADALGPNPKSPEALHALLAHPKADKIKVAFGLIEPTPEFFGEDDPIPLTDVWPGLEQHLQPHQKTYRLIRCERILVAGKQMEWSFRAPDIYVSDLARNNYLAEREKEGEFAPFFANPEDIELQIVAKALSLRLDRKELESVLHRKTPQEVEERRAAVREHATDAERLLAAVSEGVLRARLPDSLLDVLESDGVSLTGTDLAEAAIATWHTDALKQHKWALDRLDPPSKWAGLPRAVQFVRSLGFSAEWAGERDGKRDPFLEVEGPYTLPELHDYQRTIADNVRRLLRNEYGDGAERRGMISMPTGSGKTRVAVQAIVEALRDDGFHGGVLWVADRDELCEQAVEAWRQVWSGIGAQAVRLRISRMWGGMEKPQPTSELHVIVATIQTLNAKLSSQPGEYEFLASFSLVVFDEAHRSIAPTFTSVMQDIGLTRFQRADEPFLLGLTATPYRGQDEDETARLVRRYGRGIISNSHKKS